MNENIKMDAAEAVANEILFRNHIFRRIDKNKRSMAKLLEHREITPEALKDDNYFLVLRRWNSYTPSMVVHDSGSKGGGYFFKWHGTGVVVDPGLNFIENFHNQGLRIQDIDYVFVTHSHFDHCAELESILTLLFEYNEEHKAKKLDKKLTLYLNLGTYKKYGDWLTSCNKKLIEKICVIDSDSLIRIPKNGDAYPIVVKPTKAIHDEIWDNKYSLGLVFNFMGDNGMEHAIGITSDTGWSPEIMEQYRECDLLVLHLGGIKEKEIYGLGPVTAQSRLYDTHLGILGTTLMLHNLMHSEESRVKMTVISEFGEELKGISKELVELICSKVEKNIYGNGTKGEGLQRLNCVIADVGTKILFDENGPFVECEEKGCSRKAEKGDVDLKGGIVAHYCKKHIPVNPREELKRLMDRNL